MRCALWPHVESRRALQLGLVTSAFRTLKAGSRSTIKTAVGVHGLVSKKSKGGTRTWNYSKERLRSSVCLLQYWDSLLASWPRLLGPQRVVWEATAHITIRKTMRMRDLVGYWLPITSVCASPAAACKANSLVQQHSSLTDLFVSCQRPSREFPCRWS